MIVVSVHTIEKTLYEGMADAIQLPGIDGELGIVSLHIPLLSLLKSGIIHIYHRGAQNTEIRIWGGFVEIQPESRVVVLADTSL